MTLAWLSLGALVVAMIVSCFTTINVGVLALALAWIVGVYLGSMSLNDVLSGFPVQLFLTLAGVTLLFTQAQLNGTLDRVAHAAVRICRGNAGLIPVMFFVLGSIIASLGPGNVATAAMLAPMAMAVAARAAIPPFLMAIMVGNGAQSGALSPVAPTGIIVTGLMDKIGLGGYELRTYIANLAAHAIIAFGGYFLLGGLRAVPEPSTSAVSRTTSRPDSTASHWLTLAVIVSAVLVIVLFLNANIGMAAFTGAVVLAALRLADHEQAIRKMPWIPILMVSGVSVLVALLEKTGGLDLFTDDPGSIRNARNTHRRDRLRHGRHLGLQQHLRRCAAGISADRARPDCAAGRRPVQRRVVDEHRRASRGHVTAVDDRRDVHRRYQRPRTGAADLQQAAGVGPVDDRHRRDWLLSGLLSAETRL